MNEHNSAPLLLAIKALETFCKLAGRVRLQPREWLGDITQRTA